nr:hypothetical protein [Tanacetum cinerariifolium]
TAKLAVDGGVRELFQQFAALLVVGLEEGAELALRQHHGTGELLEVKPQPGFKQGLVFGLVLAAENLLAVQIGQGLTTGLKLFCG